MRVRALDANKDWTFGQGQNNFFSNNAAIVQNIRTRLLMFLGDCFFDLGAGIDWINLLGSKNQVALNLAISTTILNTENVVGIRQLTTDFNSNTRNFSVSYTVQTVYSTIITNTFTYSLNGTAANA